MTAMLAEAAHAVDRKLRITADRILVLRDRAWSST
jgi:hypothetical protein